MQNEIKNDGGFTLGGRLYTQEEVDKLYKEAYEKGKEETVNKMRKTLNEIKKDLRLNIRSLYSVEIIEEAFNKIENYDKNNSTLQ